VTATTVRSTAATLPLLHRHDASSVVAYRVGRAVSTTEFLADVARIAALLPPGRHVLNTCADRYRFAVTLGAILVSGRVTLLPSTLTPQTIAQLKALTPDAFHLTDGSGGGIDLPTVRYVDSVRPAGAPSPIPEIARETAVAYVFTSGSTGLPVPHRKTWGALVDCVRAEADILGLSNGRPHAILGTVPPQHMYGFESTVLIALQGGLPFSNARPLYPADICAELEVLPRPRVLVTTPFHLRTLLDAGVTVPAVDLIVSATAPLPPALAREAEARCSAPLREIYGSTETGQIASRRTTEGPAWQLFPLVRLGTTDGRHYASGGHVEGSVGLDDVLELLDDHRFLLHGRSADMVNIAGKRSSLGYLNHQLCAVPGVVDGAFVLPELPGQEATGAVARLNAAVVAPDLDQTELVRALRERIDPAFMPRRIVFVDRLPRNATGKLPAAALHALFPGPAQGSGQ
jgi:acyl-coenzyme A synthetase/AMP-(fatty) acid ligase